ncbi:hypothetical protein FGSG_10489 [Fusarium graminearum PH-1]|uniref:Uncharacterized protein n=1 Tax=Gibberella zeae (strain ATCC MYA-4620 / CBS 123657 / FGSC 9075 / NRRL 31084 / PH-1) TaxID=229533 RepID=I1S189_GIBZE|nr:hypothetical protein FGSG_10489 [Fusarium graminearum PH-1]ESU17213.1 hypothetical protein FGSG_10489 [Fusarium graminearum PH-1]|eukprot:XP_011319475.1 hypothetical protein FGSG_10489 [Fusarium graminearum PH-1]
MSNMSNDEPQDHDMLDNDVESPIVDSDHVIELLNHVDPNAEVMMEDAEMGAIPQGAWNNHFAPNMTAWQATVDDADDEGSETSRPKRDIGIVWDYEVEYSFF